MIKSVTIVLSGQAGQGLATVESLVVNAIKKQHYVFSTKEVMSRVRGGNNTVEIRVADQPVFAYKEMIDILFLLNNHSFYRLHDRINENTLILGEPTFIDEAVIKEKGATFINFNLEELSSKSGGYLFGNTILYGYISGLLRLNDTHCKSLITKRFSKKSEKVREDNIQAFTLGYELGLESKLPITLQQTDAISNHKILSGTDAIGIGALAGGINYIASYPMSPGTGVLEYLADKGEEFEVIVEQAEDEIAAINMCIGAWYAGARAMVTTSGGGFALMEEGISLSGITETPAVIHIAQRPGPGTGLPTRTEQADLNLAVYAGHGEFPRIVLAPGSMEDGVLLTQKAFYLADKYQVPVFILSDQYYVDSYCSISPVPLSENYLESFVVKTNSDYKRYKLTPNGISERGIPGFGDGLVKVDSDEHDERGSITEDFNVRIKMNDKRLGKQALILEDYIEPELIGAKDFKNLIVGWGSTYGVLKEAVESSSDKDLAFLQIKEVYPLSDSVKALLQQAHKILLFENNATAQLGNLIKLQLDVSIEQRALKYNGVPFTIEEVDRKIEEVFQ